MWNDASRDHASLFELFLPCSLLGVFVFLTAFVLAQTCYAQDHEKEGAGAVMSRHASAEDVGMPLYPGSKPHQDESSDSSAARLGLWGGGSGFKLAVVKMETGDSPEKVAAFYKKALSKYGKVLDCSYGSPAQAEADKKESATTLSCGNDKPEKGGMLFKSGTKEQQHIAAIQANGRGSLYQLVAVAAWDGDAKK